MDALGEHGNARELKSRCHAQRSDTMEHDGAEETEGHRAARAGQFQRGTPDTADSAGTLEQTGAT